MGDGAAPSAEDRDRIETSRRTYMAEERTFLAWLRSGLAALAVSLAVGRLLPVLLDAQAGPYKALGVGFGMYGMFLMFYGPIRHRDVRRALARGAFAPLPTGVVWVLSVAGVLLSFGTIAAILVSF